MIDVQYTLGWDETAMRFLTRRTLDSHGAFFVPYLAPGMHVLDCACGPGSITQGIARAVAPGAVTGIDMSASQIAMATARAQGEGITNAKFREASIYELPFPDASFDAVFSHALLEHLGEPVRAAKECLRVLKPGGVIGVATPDWDGFIVAPETPELVAAVRTYREAQDGNGGDTRTGRKLGTILREAGFMAPRMQARYENYDPSPIIGEVISLQLQRDGHDRLAAVVREWQADPEGLWAQAWVSCVARKPA